MPLKNRKIIVTGGPTREWIDPVRFISNASSGKMGVAIADVAAKRSREVVFIHGPVDAGILGKKKYRCVRVETTEDLRDAVLEELVSRSILIMAAAPADYAPVEKSSVKIKKSDNNMTLLLKKTPDILRAVSDTRSINSKLEGLFVVGFAAETTNAEEYALGKLAEKNLDMICLNDVSREGAGFGVDTNIVTIFTRKGKRIDLPVLSKKEVAGSILDSIEDEIGK